MNPALNMQFKLAPLAPLELNWSSRPNETSSALEELEPVASEDWVVPDWSGLPAGCRCEERFYSASDSENQTWKTQSRALTQQTALLSEVRGQGSHAHTLRVEMRQRQSPSLVRLFLCLNPPIMRSQTYCRHSRGSEPHLDRRRRPAAAAT